MLYYLYFPEEQLARVGADRAAQAGWQAEVRELLPEYPDSWTLVCEQQDVLTSADFIRDSTDYFEELAEDLGGECDGWDASA